MSQNDPHSLLQRILGEEADPLIQMLRQPGADEALLKSRGIDSNAMLERAKAQISRAEKLTEHGINPPIPLEELTDAQFEALDIPTLEKYLAAGDVDVQRLITRTKQLLEDAKPQPAPGFFARLGALLPQWPSAPVAGLAVGAMVLVAVGVGVLRLAPQSPTVPAVQLQEPALSVTLAETAQQKPLAKALPMPQTLSAQAPEIVMAESSALQESAQGETAAMPISDAAITAIRDIEKETLVAATQLAEEVEVTEVTDAAEPTVTATQTPSEEEAPLSMSEEVTLAQNLVTQSETQSDAIPEAQWALTAAPAEAAGKEGDAKLTEEEVAAYREEHAIVVAEGTEANILAKLEFYNPASSVKDRLGIAIVDAAEASGELPPGGTIVVQVLLELARRRRQQVTRRGGDDGMRDVRSPMSAAGCKVWTLINFLS